MSKFAEAYRKRTGILADTEAIHKKLMPGLCSMIKMEEVSEPLHETPGKTAEAVLHFCQVVQTG